MRLNVVNKVVLIWLFDKNVGDFRGRNCVSIDPVMHSRGY